MAGWGWNKLRHALSDSSPVARQKAALMLQEAADQEGVSVEKVVEFLRANPDSTLAHFSDKFSGTMANAMTVATKKGREGTASYYAGQNRRAIGALDNQLDETMGTKGRTYKDVLGEVSEEKARIGKEEYQKVFSAAPEFSADEQLGAILQRPTVQKALKKVMKASEDTPNPITEPSWEALHEAQSEIGDMIGKASREGKSKEARRLIELKRDIQKALDDKLPGYQQARQMYSDTSSIERAAESGRELFKGSKSMEFLDEMADMPQGSAEQAAFVVGVKDAIRELVQRKGALATRGALTESQRSKLRDVLGAEADEIFNAIDNMVEYAKPGVVANSVQGALQNPIPLLGGGEFTSLSIGNKAIAAASLAGRIRMLANQVTPQAADELLELVARPMRTPADLAKIEQAMTRIIQHHYGAAGVGGVMGGDIGAFLGNSGILEER
jgi:hypothetical protein